jgi:hypothetical protein
LQLDLCGFVVLSKIHSIVIKEMHRYYINKAKLAGIKSPYPGSISFTQRSGSALNVNPHLHVLLLDGVYTEITFLFIAFLACSRPRLNPSCALGPNLSLELNCATGMT